MFSVVLLDWLCWNLFW